MDPSEPIRAVVFYGRDQASGTADGDDVRILTALREAGFVAELVDLAHLRAGDPGTLLVDGGGECHPWPDPHVALMYHGAIAPAGALELLSLIEARGTTVVNGSVAWPVFSDKHRFAAYMREHGVRVIPGELAHSGDELCGAVDRLGGVAVAKRPVSTEGDFIHVIRTQDELAAAATQLDIDGGPLIVQPVIDSRIGDDIEPGVAAHLHEGERGRRHEFRVNTARLADGSISVDACYMRVAPDDQQVVNNVAQGARAIVVPFEELHPLDQDTVLRAALRAPARGDLVGWDLLGLPGQRVIVEGNSGSGLPKGTEGSDPRIVTDSYVEVLRAHALASPLMRGSAAAGAAPQT